ncbi:uncharacterized protein LOC112350277 [Selaginella moellendorffii]|uniref:uncharacterized protein LOC112350277 n=1 Tax=Selaginella moellendorffii TaxID=88036 RepID=UPI000D1D0DCF|nr:uncharacterized protein LOC112350277 [Selaginella moellendorffii]|eukprot:XP_024541952.1 uncharacterized protein LOC112350277 [Selaginella moellendorffii]
MEEGTPILESFTQSVADGPSQPLVRKLMSLMLSEPSSIPPIQDPDDASGFLLVEAPAGGISRPGALDAVEDIAQTAGCPVEDMENVVQSGFRFAGSEGCCDSPRVESYFSESQIPADLADKVPIDFLHAINNVLDTRVVPVPKGHHHHHHHGHGRRRSARKRAPPALSLGNKELVLPREEEQGGTGFASTDYAQEMVTRRLDRLEEICLRTESYVQMVLGTMDRRLQLLEGDGISRCTLDSMTSPRFPGGSFSCEAGTFVTPEMLMVQSPRPDRISLFATDVAASAGLEVSCQASEDPALVLSTPVPSVSQPSEYPFATLAGERPEITATVAPSTPNTGDEITTMHRQEDEGTSERPLVAAIAVFSLAPDAAVDALLSEPVLTWENEGFPYLRPAYQVELEPRPRDTTVLTWDAARYLAPESTSSEDERATCHSSEEAFAFCNLDDEPRRLKEDTEMLSEVSSLLQNICADLEAYGVPEDERTIERCPHCRFGPACIKDQEEIISVLEEMFTRLTYWPRPEDVLMSVLPVSGAFSANASVDEVAFAPAAASSRERVIEGVQYAQLPQQEDVDEISSTKTERSLEIFPLEGSTSPRVALSFIQEDGMSSEVEQAPQHMKIEMPPPKQDAPNEPLALHVAIAPKEIKVVPEDEPGAEEVAPSVIQDISVTLEGSYSQPVVHENDVVGDNAAESREVVAVSRDQLQLSGDVFADYTLKVVPRPEQQQEGAPLVVSQDNKMVINEEEVSSVIHELCFALDVPSRASQADKSKEPELPLQIAIALTGSGSGASDHSMVARTSVEDISSSEASSSTQQQKEIASIILNLKALQKSEERPMTFNWEGVPAASECDDIPCLLKVEEKKLAAANDEFTSVHQEVRISLEVPTETRSEAAGPGVQIGIAVKSVPKRAGDEENAIYTVEIPDDTDFEKVPLSETVEREAEPAIEELVPLTKAAASPAKTLVVENRSLGDELLLESILAPPPSPGEAAPETHDFVVKEEKKAEEEWVIDTSFLPKENSHKVEAKVPKTVLKGVTTQDLIRGSLHFDGKACLLSISTDDIWTTEDMCQASVPGAAGKEKSSLPFLADKGPGLRNGAEPLIREIPAWLGDVLIDEVKQACAGSAKEAFGFGGGKQQQQQQQAGIQRQVLGFRSLPGRQVRPGQPKPSQEAAFGFRSLPPKSGRPPLPTAVAAVKPSISVTVPVSSDGFADWDSTLSLVTRGGSPPQSLAQQEQADPTKPRVPDSPGARSCIINRPSELGRSSSGVGGGGSASTLAVEPEFEQDAQAPAKTIISDAASASTPSQTTPTSTLTLEQTSSPLPLPPAAKMALDLLDAGSGEESSGEAQQAAWSSDGLHVLPLDALQEETFFDALECSAAGRSGGGTNSNNGKIKRYLKDKLWNKFSCYGVGLPESDSSDAGMPCHHHRILANNS